MYLLCTFMAKRLEDNKRFNALLQKRPVTGTKAYLEIKNDVNALIDLSGESVEAIAKVLQITRQSLGRKRRHKIWTPEELLVLFEYLGIKD
jgi:hypothetical protein